jgi:hypothetical protein
MSKHEGKQDPRLKNTDQTEDASVKKGSEKLIKVKKEDNAEDKDNEFRVLEKPSDEQMHESFDDLRKDQKGGESA